MKFKLLSKIKFSVALCSCAIQGYYGRLISFYGSYHRPLNPFKPFPIRARITIFPNLLFINRTLLYIKPKERIDLPWNWEENNRRVERWGCPWNTNGCLLEYKWMPFGVRTDASLEYKNMPRGIRTNTPLNTNACLLEYERMPLRIRTKASLNTNTCPLEYERMPA